MFCQNCGTKFDGKFCPNCGTPSVVEQKVTIIQSIHDEDPNLTSDFFVSIRALEKIFSQVEKLIQEYDEIEIVRAIESQNMQREIEAARNDSLTAKAVKGYFAVATLGLSTALTKKSDQAKKEKHVEKIIAAHTPALSKLENQLSETARKIRVFAETPEWKLAKLVIPEEIFYDIDAVKAINQYCTMGRVSTRKEAINLYFDEGHKQRMETIALAQLSIADQNLQVQREMCSLIENISAEMLSISEHLNNELECMTKIRKRTDQTARASRFTAACMVFKLFAP